MKFHSSDLSSGLVVFLVALPLCLGIALASGAPLFSGLIAGVVGGVVVGFFSGSKLGVSGPAAGLTVIVLNAITELGSFQIFLMSVVLAGIFQLLFGVIKAGYISFYFPSSVIKGMLAAIGILIILKQIPHAFGIDKDPEGDETFVQPDGENTLSELLNIFPDFLPGAVIISLIGFAIILLWESSIIKSIKALKYIPGSLVAVLAGILINIILPESLKLASTHLVNIPDMNSMGGFINLFTLPDFNSISNTAVWQSALLLAIIASLETLLCVEATDKMDIDKSITPPNRELFAQGIGNIASGLIGGLPVTQVIVRSSANVQSGGKSKMSTIIHGILLAISVIFIPTLLNLIPLSALAAVLIMVGFKLAKPDLFKSMFKQGQDQFVPFIVTIVAIIFTDLLVGILIGLAVGFVYVFMTNFRNAVSVFKDNNDTIIRFNKDVYFFNRAEVMKALSAIGDNQRVYVDGSAANFIDHDIYLTIEEFSKEAKNSGTEVVLRNISRTKINFFKNNEVISKSTIS